MNQLELKKDNTVTQFISLQLLRTQGPFLLKILEQINNNPASAEVQSLICSVKV